MAGILFCKADKLSITDTILKHYYVYKLFKYIHWKPGKQKRSANL